MYFVRKDPDAIEDYSIDWLDWLGPENLQSATWIVPSGLTLHTSSTEGTVAKARIGGGVEGGRYTVTCRATSSTGRVTDRSIVVICEQM